MLPGGDAVCGGDMGTWFTFAVGGQPAFQIVQATAAAHDPRFRDQIRSSCRPKEGDVEARHHRDHVWSLGRQHAAIHGGVGKTHHHRPREYAAAVLPRLGAHELLLVRETNADRALPDAFDNLTVMVDRRQVLDDGPLYLTGIQVGRNAVL